MVRNAFLSFTVIAQQTLKLALQHHRAGRLAEAEALYRQILASEPGHAEARHLLGLVAHQVGRHDLALELIRQATTLDPNNPAAHTNLGEVCRTLGRTEEALTALRRAIQLGPNSPEAHNNLGNVLRNHGQMDEAAIALRRAIELKPDYADAYSNLGVVLAEKGQLDEAIVVFQHALQLKPHGVAAYNNLGNALKNRGAFGKAVETFQRALQLDPNHFEVHNNLGTVLVLQGRFDEAEMAFHRSLELKPDYTQALNNLGNVLKDQGRWDEAVPAFRRALQSNLDSPEIHSNLVYTLLFQPGADRETIEAEGVLWNRQYAEPLKRSILPHANARNPERRLRLGYISADFWGHVVGRNLVPLFRYHDHDQFEIFCYSGVVHPDSLTDKFRKQADHWRDMMGVSDEAFAEAIKRDGVDVLIDLSQHMAGNRLSLFARQPAPVQASFAGYPEATGVEAIRYRISDRYMEGGSADDESARAGKRRDRVFLVDSFWCYEPSNEVSINPLPAEANGHVTFGCLNSFCKINEPLLRLWARVLAGVPGSRLILLSSPGSHCERIRKMMAEEGIETHRLEFVPRCTHRVYLELYHRLDMVLDPSPYNGHTTSLDALWMGVPVVSLAGTNPVSRAGLSQLTNLGLEEFVAWSEDDYVAIATRLAGDLPRLAELRRTLRARIEASLIMDAPRFARSIEAGYRTMWRQWCMESPIASP